MPLGFGCPSGINAGPALLFTPFFLGPSVGGGGIDDAGTGVPLATGVFDVDSDGLLPFELVATGRVLEVVDEESFEGDSSLTMGFSEDLSKYFGGTLNLTIRVGLLDDFLRAAEAGGLVMEAIVDDAMKRVRELCGDGRIGLRDAAIHRFR